MLSHSRINFLEVLRISCLTLLITRVIITLFTFKIFLPKTGSRFLNLTSDQFFSNFSPQRGKFLHHDRLCFSGFYLFLYLETITDYDKSNIHEPTPFN